MGNYRLHPQREAWLLYTVVGVLIAGIIGAAVWASETPNTAVTIVVKHASSASIRPAAGPSSPGGTIPLTPATPPGPLTPEPVLAPPSIPGVLQPAPSPGAGTITMPEPVVAPMPAVGPGAPLHGTLRAQSSP